MTDTTDLQRRAAALKQWPNTTLVAALLSLNYRLLDAGGLSSGRSLQSEYTEPALALLEPFRPSGDIVDWPSADAIVSEARERVRNAALSAREPSALEQRLRAYADIADSLEHKASAAAMREAADTIAALTQAKAAVEAARQTLTLDLPEGWSIENARTVCEAILKERKW